jgi:N-acylneuraminate cytidylyltransferase
MYTLDEKHALRPLLPSSSNAKRRQDLRAVYTLNGAIYIANIAWLRQSRAFATKETVAYIMPAARSIDIDTAADFEMFRRTIALNEKLYA